MEIVAVTEPTRSAAFTHCAVIPGRAALILAAVLRGSLRQGLALRQLVVEMRLSVADQEAVLAAEQALEDCGQRWRISQLAEIRGNSETSGNGSGVASELDMGAVLSTSSAARIVGRSERRVRQLAVAGDLPA